MPKIKKKGTSGQAKNFITRSQAVRKLQISLPDFRRLCIFKGIYPREPRNKRKASKSSTPSTTFYYTKDIQYLLHEPLIQKFRDHKALGKKIARALGRGEVKDAARLERTHTPRITLDHIIKERYPTFVDALRDLDDALSMLFLFANLPSTAAVPSKTIALCQRLCHEFQHYLIITHSIRKSFLSIKGIYYQATIQGQDILWLVPYKFVQRMGGDIDFRIMGTFVEFYTTLLGFVNYRLYTSIGLVYPPKFDTASDEKGGELSAFILEGRGLEEAQNGISENYQVNGEQPKAVTSEAAQAEADRIVQEAQSEDDEPEDIEPVAPEEPGQTIDKFEAVAEGGDVLLQPQVSSSEAGSLFTPFTFYLSRETPRQPLELLLKAFGCKRVGWDAIMGDGAFTTNEADPSITHQIVDRPALPPGALPQDNTITSNSAVSGRLPPGTRVPGRTYVQPQWVWDCINSVKLLRPDLYAPGATLPPHLSPWVKPKRGAYDPTAPLEEQEREGEAEAADLDAEIEDAEHNESDEETQPIKSTPQRKRHDALLDRDDEVEVGEGMEVASANSDSESESEAPGDEWGGLSSADEEDADEVDKVDRQHQRELEAEATGTPFAIIDAGNTPGKALKEKREEAKRKADKKRREDDEELQRQMMMMSQKKRRLLQTMQYSNQKTEAEAERLRGKRRKIERSKQKSGKL